MVVEAKLLDVNSNTNEQIGQALRRQKDLLIIKLAPNFFVFYHIFHNTVSEIMLLLLLFKD